MKRIPLKWSGKWTTMPVPSCWELQGFGKYDYGFTKDSLRGKESGLYRHTFLVPANWKGKMKKNPKGPCR